MPLPEEPAPRAPTGAHGRAALLLVESLIHRLAERALLSVPEAIEIISVALDAQTAILEDEGDASPDMAEAEVLLRAMLKSFEMDLPTLAGG